MTSNYQKTLESKKKFDPDSVRDCPKCGILFLKGAGNAYLCKKCRPRVKIEENKIPSELQEKIKLLNAINIPYTQNLPSQIGQTEMDAINKLYEIWIKNGKHKDL